MLTASLAAGDVRIFHVFGTLWVDLHREKCNEARDRVIVHFDTSFIALEVDFGERPAKIETGFPGVFFPICDVAPRRDGDRRRAIMNFRGFFRHI